MRNKACVITRDELPNVAPKKNTYYIVNTLRKGETGKLGHWFLLFYNAKEKKTYVICSYGLQIYKNLIPRYMQKRVWMNNKTLQSTSTAVCGQFCVFILFLLCRHYSIANILKVFHPSDLLFNEKLVYNFACKKFKIITPFYVQDVHV